MIEIRAYHKFNYFGPITAIDPTPANITKYVSAFSDLQLVPNTLQQIEVQGNQETGLIEGQPIVKTRLQFISSDQQWHVEVNDGLISITEVRPKEGDLESTNDFLEKVITILRPLTSDYSIKAQRIAYLTKGLFNSMNDTEMINANSNLIKLPKIHTDNPPFEWDTRSVSNTHTNLDGNDETLNFITKINRKRGTLRYSAEPYDRIEIEFDINTIYQNRDARLDNKHIADFSKYIEETVPTVELEAEEIING